MSSDNEDTISWCHESPRRMRETASPVAIDHNLRVCTPCNTPWEVKDIIRKIDIIKDDNGGDGELNIFVVNGYMAHTTFMLNDKW